MKKPALFILIGLLAVLSSCEKNITLEFPEYEPKIVVEGSIFENEYPVVILTRSTSYFDTLNTSELVTVTIFGMPVQVPAYLYEMVVTDALVTVSDGEITDTLQLGFNPYVFPYLQYQGSKIKGETNRIYTLTVEADSQIITSVTTIPDAVPLDSIWFESLGEQSDSAGLIHANFIEPQGIPNYYRVFSKTIGRDSVFVHPWFSIFDDKRLSIVDTVEIRLFHGNNDLDSINDPFRSYFIVGEQVRIRLCTMDYEHYQFWESYQQVAGGGGNPFAAPTEIKSNIQGGLGVWGGYGVYETNFLVVLPDTTTERKSSVMKSKNRIELNNNQSTK